MDGIRAHRIPGLFLGTRLPGADPPEGWGAQHGVQTTYSLGRNFAIVIILPFVARPPQGMVLTIQFFHPPTYPTFGSFFISLVIDDLFSSIPVFLINSCSANSCNFGVPVGGDELRVFLLHHLAHFPLNFFSVFFFFNLLGT